MIARVYESVEKTILQKTKKTITKERKVKKKIESWEEKYVDQAPQEGYCGRCNRSYKYGDNPKDPDKCPRCICIDCKRSIMERRKTSTHGEAINRCYSDWYRYQFGKNYYGYKTGYEIDYNHRIPKELPPILKKIPIEKEVEMSESYTEEVEVEVPIKITEDKIIDATNIAHSKQNQIITKAFSGYQHFIEEYLLIDKYFQTSDLTKHEKWYGSKSHSHVLDLINLNRTMDSVKITSLPVLEYNQLIIGEKQVLEEFQSVVGFYPNVPAYIQGHPLNMYNNKRVNKVEIEKSINIYFNATMDSKNYESQYNHRGIICYSLIEYFMNEHIKVNLKLIDASFIDGETYIQSIDFDYDTIKNDMKMVYNFLTVSAVLRVMMLEFKASMVKKGKLNQAWLRGFGYYLDSETIKSILNLNDNDILFGTPNELKILGFDMEDDFINCAETLGLSSLYEPLVKIEDTVDYIKGDIVDTIRKRGITKLIHFTSVDNLDSIKKLGILPREELINRQMTFDYNDEYRIDNNMDAICLSVSNPNRYLIQEFTHRYPDKKYVMLEIDPAILYEIKNQGVPIKRIYYDYNAASRYAKKSLSDLNIMFKDSINKRHIVLNRENKKDYEPTSDQAEILFFGQIPFQYIQKITNYQ